MLRYAMVKEGDDFNNNEGNPPLKKGL